MNLRFAVGAASFPSSPAAGRFEVIIAFVVGLVGVIVMAGWIFQVSALVRLHPQWASMKFNTALCFFALALGLYLLTRRRLRESAFLAGLVIAISVLTLTEYALRVDLLIDTVVDPSPVDTRTPLGRMTPVTAALFLLSSIALGLCCIPDTARFSGAVGILASVVGGVSLAAIIGYLSGTPAAYEWGTSYAPGAVALHTACSFVPISAAIATEAATRSRDYLPRWLPWTALLGGLACTLALGKALSNVLDPGAASSVPVVAIAVAGSLSVLASVALHAQRLVGNQRRVLASTLQKQQYTLVERARLAAIVESSGDAIISVDLEDRIVVWNAAAESMFGYQAAEVLGRSPGLIIPSDAVDAAAKADNDARAGTSTLGLRTFRRHRDGRILPVEVDVSPVRNDLQATIGIATIVRNVAMTLASERMIQGVLEAAPDAMLVVDTGGGIVLANRMAESMFGYSREELVGQPIELLIPDHLRALHQDLRAQFTRTPRPMTMGAGRELQAVRKHAIEFPAEITLNHLDLPNRTVIVAAIRDITARRETKRRLEDSLAEKELLLKEIHHRVKNNLQIVASMLALQTEQVDDPRVRTPLEQCRRRVLSMSLVHEKLYGAHDLRRIDLGELVREISSMLLSDDAVGRIRVAFHIDPVIVDIETAFPASLLVNELITNALKHALKGRPQGSLEIAVHQPRADRAEIVVADDGPGGVTAESLLSSPSLGSTIIRSLARQLDAGIHIATPGCRITVAFPLRGAYCASCPAS